MAIVALLLAGAPLLLAAGLFAWSSRDRVEAAAAPDGSIVARIVRPGGVIQYPVTQLIVDRSGQPISHADPSCVALRWSANPRDLPDTARAPDTYPVVARWRDATTLAITDPAHAFGLPRFACGISIVEAAR